VARSIARKNLKFYLDKSNYLSVLRRLGFVDEDLVGGGSDRLVDALVAWGDEVVIAKRISEHLDAGADHVALHVLGDETDPGAPDCVLPREAYRRLADAVTRPQPTARPGRHLDRWLTTKRQYESSKPMLRSRSVAATGSCAAIFQYEEAKATLCSQIGS
jgi:hypothetical protein